MSEKKRIILTPDDIRKSIFTDDHRHLLITFSAKVKECPLEQALKKRADLCPMRSGETLPALLQRAHARFPILLVTYRWNYPRDTRAEDVEEAIRGIDDGTVTSYARMGFADSEDTLIQVLQEGIPYMNTRPALVDPDGPVSMHRPTYVYDARQGERLRQAWVAIEPHISRLDIN